MYDEVVMILKALFKILCTVFLLLIVNKIVFTMIHRVKITKSPKLHEWIVLLLNSAYIPIQAFILCYGAYNIVYLFESDFFIKHIDNLYQISFLCIMCWFLLRLKTNIEMFIQSKKEILLSKFDPALIKLMSQIVKIIIIFFVGAIILYVFGIPLQSLVVLQGAVSIAIGISAQNVLGNGFGGLMILIYQPFKVGDLISSPDKKIEGYVEEIRWDSTKIINLDRRPLYVPNSMLTQIIILNSSDMHNRHILQTVNLRYQDVDKVQAITREIRDMLKLNDEIDQKLAVLADWVEFGPQSLRIQVNAFTKTVNGERFFQVQQDICVKIAHIIKNNHAEIAVISHGV